MAKVDTSLVAHLPLFSGVKPDDLEEILREARSARYPRNAAIFEQGADAQSFFLLLTEQVAPGEVKDGHYRFPNEPDLSRLVDWKAVEKYRI